MQNECNNKNYELTNGAHQFHKKITLYKLAEHFVFTHSALNFQFEKLKFFNNKNSLFTLIQQDQSLRKISHTVSTLILKRSE